MLGVDLIAAINLKSVEESRSYASNNLPFFRNISFTNCKQLHLKVGLESLVSCIFISSFTVDLLIMMEVLAWEKDSFIPKRN